MKIKADINDTINRKIMEKINGNKSLFFGKINKMNEHVSCQINQEKRDMIQMFNIKNERSFLTTDCMKIEKIINE